MIRLMQATDYPDVLVAFVDSGAERMPWLKTVTLERKLVSSKVALIDERDLGFAFIPHPGLGGNCQQVSFWIVPGSSRDPGQGQGLYSALLPWLAQERGTLWTGFPEERLPMMLKIFEPQGFAPWYSVLLMEYSGQQQPEPDLKIRRYQEEDFPRLLGLLNEAFLSLRRELDITPHLLYNQTAFTNPVLAKEILGEGYHIVSAQDGRVAGAMLVNDCLDDIAVANAHRGKGYGRRMVQHGVNRLLEQGQTPLLYVIEGNLPAVALYKGLGFKTSERFIVLRRPAFSEQEGILSLH